MAGQSYEEMRTRRLEELKKRAEMIEQLRAARDELHDAQKEQTNSSLEVKSQVDLDHRIKESKQGHLFRNVAFGLSCLLWLGVAYVWFRLFSKWPEPTDDFTPPVQLYYLCGMKTSLATVVLIAVTLGVMRFALRCYGYHHLQEGKKDSSDSDDKGIYESLKALLKDQPPQ